MLKFRLIDENTYKSYGFNLNMTEREFDDFIEYEIPNEYDEFIEKMETSGESWSGVHDFDGEPNEVGYSSYEIEDFDTAIKMWFDFFKQYDKIDKDSVIIIEDII